MLLVLGVIRFLPSKVVYKFAELLARVVFVLEKRHSSRAVEHILHAGIVNDKKSARKIAVASFIHLAKVGVDVIKLDKYVTAENIASHFKVRYKTKEAEEVIKNSDSFIFIGAHYGNWEVSGLAASVLVKPILSVMRPFDNKKIGDYFISRRKMFRQELCLQHNALRHTLKAIKEGKAVGIIADQHAGGKESVETVFFGHPASTHTSPAILHLKTGAALIFGAAKRLDDNFNYEFAVYGPFKLEKKSGDMQKDIKDLCQMFTSAIEEEIRRDPTQWLWSHRRWLDINR